MKQIIILFGILVSMPFFGVSQSDTQSNIIEFYGTAQNKTLQSLLDEAYSISKVPVIYFYADWCGPCRAFKKSLSDKKVQKSLVNALFIKINVDEDLGKHNIYERYDIRVIPTFVKVTKAGDMIAKISSDKWDKDVPKNIAPVMYKLINQNVYDIE